MTSTDSSAIGLRNAVAAFAKLQAFFDTDDWSARPNKDDPFCLVAAFEGRHGQTTVGARIVEDREWFRVLVLAPFYVPRESRQIVAEFISRANYGLPFGAFEMDHADGELGYRWCINFAGSELKEDDIGDVIFGCAGVMDEYLPGLMAVVYGDVEPEAAIRKIETPADVASVAGRADDLPS